MDIISWLSDPKVIIIVLAIAALGIFCYFSWKKTSTCIAELENGHKRLQKQLAHGVISDERINPLRIENASNMSEDTMDYDYPRNPEEVDETRTISEGEGECETESDNGSEESTNETDEVDKIKTGQNPKFIDHFNNLHRQHSQHSQPNFEQHYGTPALPSKYAVPGHELIGELRSFKSEDDIIIIQEDDYASDSEEPIEFHDIDDVGIDDTSARAYAIEKHEPEPEPVSLMQQKKDQLIQQKIKQDIDRMDHENKLIDQCSKVQQPKITTKPSPKQPSVPPTGSSRTLKTSPRIKATPKPKPVMTPKKKINIPLKTGGNTPKTKIQPKIKNIGIKV